LIVISSLLWITSGFAYVMNGSTVSSANPQSIGLTVTSLRSLTGSGMTFTGVLDTDWVTNAFIDHAKSNQDSALEIGFGGGATAKALFDAFDELGINRGFKLCLNDKADTQVEQCKDQGLNVKNFKLVADVFDKYPRLEKAYDDGQITFLMGEFENLDARLIPAGSLGSVLASRVFHFIPKWEENFKKIHKWLKPGGVLFITTGSYFLQPHIATAIKNGFDIFAYEDTEGCGFEGNEKLRPSGLFGHIEQNSPIQLVGCEKAYGSQSGEIVGRDTVQFLANHSILETLLREVGFNILSGDRKYVQMSQAFSKNLPLYQFTAFNKEGGAIEADEEREGEDEQWVAKDLHDAMEDYARAKKREYSEVRKKVFQTFFGKGALGIIAQKK